MALFKREGKMWGVLHSIRLNVGVGNARGVEMHLLELHRLLNLEKRERGEPTAHVGLEESLVAQWRQAALEKTREAKQDAGSKYASLRTTEATVLEVCAKQLEESIVWSEDYTCPCGIYVHPARRMTSGGQAFHISDCPYAPPRGASA